MELTENTLLAVIGCGAMGVGIAQTAAVAGHTVLMYDNREGAAGQAIEGLRRTLQTLAEKGKIRPEQALAAAARLRPANELSDLAGAGLVIEAIVENPELKQKLFVELEDIVADDCILASNTSSISITALAARLRCPARLAGMHFFNPVPLMALVEIIQGLATDRAVSEALYALALAWGKSPVHAKSTPGFIVNRVARPYYAEALRLLSEQAADPATIDLALREAGGFRMGPFELMDLIGLDVNFAVTNTVYQAYFHEPRFKPSLIQQEMVNAGFLGKKSGRGFYRYGAGTTPPQGQSEPAQAAPPSVVVCSESEAAQALAARFAQAGIAVQRMQHDTAKSDGEPPLLMCGGARVYPTDGRSATHRAQQTRYPDTVLLDLAFDYPNAARVVLAKADQCSPAAYLAVVGALQAAGYAVTTIDDVAGMVVMRTVAMLANEAADAVLQGVCDVAAVDLAMQKGVNYPRGPLLWADRIGIAEVVQVLQNMAAWYGEDRYRISPLLQRTHLSGRNFHA